MLPISANELTSLQTEANTLLTNTATVTRVATDGQSSVGGRTRTTSSFSVACKLLQHGEYAVKAEEVPSDRVGLHSRWRLLVPVGTGIQLRDKVTVGSKTFVVIRSDTERDIQIFEAVALQLLE